RDADVVVSELVDTGLVDEPQVPGIKAPVPPGTIGPKTIRIPQGHTPYSGPRYYHDFRIAAPKHQWPFYEAPQNGWCHVNVLSLARRQEVATVRFDTLTPPAVARTLDFAIAAPQPVTGVKLSGTVRLRPGLTIGATNAMNGDKVFPVEPVEHRGRIRLRIDYEMGAGMETLRLSATAGVGALL